MGSEPAVATFDLPERSAHLRRGRIDGGVATSGTVDPVDQDVVDRPQLGWSER